MLDKEIIKQADWCKENCPELAAFNRAYVIRNGGGLIPYVELHGSHDDIVECVKRETEFLAQNAIISSNHFLTKETKDDTGRNVYLFTNGQRSQHKAGNLYFYENHCSEHLKNVFSVTGCATTGKINYLANAFRMEISDLTAILAEYKDWTKYNVKEIINQVLIYHYMHHDDDTFLKDDFQVLSTMKQEESASSIKNTLQTGAGYIIVDPKAELSQHIEKTFSNHGYDINENESCLDKKLDRSSVKKESMNSETKTKTTDQDQMKDAALEESEKEETSKEQADKKIEISDDAEPEIPLPKEKKARTIAGKMKEELTDEEKRKNSELVDNLLISYNDTIKFIQSLKTNKWKFMINKMNEAVKRKKFTIQWCPLYLEVSDDISDPLYKQLYDLDIETKEFNQKLVHQIKKLVCPVCGNHWDEDITFVEPGLHDVECPVCYSGRRYEKV